jgi:hypothetical protein
MTKQKDEKSNLLDQKGNKEISIEDSEKITIDEIVIIVNRKLAENINKNKIVQEVIAEYF